ncbi:complement C5-like [Leptodactylus fuscus]|uniref:complement C5-like n=1 Tax=Leptodactylus fuscus TaxID=238119 RepID=UPI003F4E6FEA
MILLQIPLLCLLYGDGWGDPLIPHVTAPGTWRLGVLESVVIRTPQQSEGFPVKVSLLSYPDKKTMFSSALLPLTPDNLFQGVVKLSITAEDSPGEFVYLMVESKVFREEARIPVSREAWTLMDEPGNVCTAVSYIWGCLFCRRLQIRSSLLSTSREIRYRAMGWKLLDYVEHHEQRNRCLEMDL